MEVTEIRKRNLEGLIGDRSKRGAVAKFARQYGLDPTYIRQILNGHRAMGEKSARNFERELGLQGGSLDIPTGGQRLSELAPGMLRVPKTNVIASMGYGAAQVEAQEITDWVTISRDWAVSRRIVLSKPENLAMIEGLGNSMEGIFNHGDILIVDRGINAVDVDGVYAFQFEGKVWIKTLQRIPGNAIQAISNNKAYTPFIISESNGESFRVLGRVVWVWTGKAL